MIYCIIPSGINYTSLEKICASSNQVMVYGWFHTKYSKVIDLLKEIDQTTQTTIQKYFDCWLGNKFKKDARVTTLEGRKMERIEYDSIPEADHCAKMCKSAIVNLVLENCKRSKDNLPLIPLLFCIDIDQNRYPTTAETITSKTTIHNEKVTNKELRRIYKICHFDNDYISSVALQTIKFAKVHFNSRNEFEFEELIPFWENPQWNDLWKDRQSHKINKQKTHDWREQLIRHVDAYLSNPA